MSSFDCFSGGTQPGGDGGAVEIARLAGGFHLFSGVDPKVHLTAALAAAAFGDIAILYGGPLNFAIVGIWQKIQSSPVLIRPITPVYTSAVWPADPSLIIGQDIILVRPSSPAPGDYPTWEDGGLKMQPQTHPVMLIGAWGGARWLLGMVGKARASGTGAGANFGGGWASDVRTQGSGGIIAESAGVWYRRSADGEFGISTALTPGGPLTASRRERAPTADYHGYTVLGELMQASVDGSSVELCWIRGDSTVDPYSTAVGLQGGLVFPSGYTQQNNQDQEIMLIADNGGAGSMEWVVQELHVMALPKHLT